MSILLDVGIGLEINVLTSKFILLGDQMLGEMGCHPEICFYIRRERTFKTNQLFSNIIKTNYYIFVLVRKMTQNSNFALKS